MADYPPLLVAGFHSMGLADIRNLCVNAPRFGLSTTRLTIMNSLDHVATTLFGAGIAGELWVDGGFLTEKIDPEDVDVLLRTTRASYVHGTPARAAADWLGANLRAPLNVDSYLWITDGGSDPLWVQSYWIRQFGFSREDTPKGIALVHLP